MKNIVKLDRLHWALLWVLLLGHPRRTCGQDGANFDPKAAAYHSPDGPLDREAGSPRDLALARLVVELGTDRDKAIASMTKLAEAGDPAVALLLARLYEGKSDFSVPANPDQELRFLRIASAHGSGEASELVAEMIENKKVPAQADGNAAKWRALAVERGWTQQELAAGCFEWTHGPEPLRCDTHPIPPEILATMYKGVAPEECPNNAEMELLRREGLTGSLRGGVGRRPHEGPKARAILIMDHHVPGEEDLKQPYATSVIYIQTPQNHWRMLPPDAPLLDRYLVLGPDSGGPGRTGMQAQDVDGSSTRSACGPSKR